MLKLAIRNDQEFREFTSEAPLLTIGRAPENTLVLKDKKVSRRHAMIQASGGTYTIMDLGSGNGTRVNGQAVSGPRVLAKGDEIRLGVTTITVVQAGAVPATPGSAPIIPAAPPTAAAPPPPAPPTGAAPAPPAPVPAASPPPGTAAAPSPPPPPAPSTLEIPAPAPPAAPPPVPAAPPPPAGPVPAATAASPPARPAPPAALPAAPEGGSAPPATGPQSPSPAAPTPSRERARPSWLPPRRSPIKAGLIAVLSLALLAVLVWGAFLTARLHKRILPRPEAEEAAGEAEPPSPLFGEAEIALSQFRAKVAGGPVTQELIDESAELSRRYSEAFPRSRYPSGSPFDRIHEELLIYADVERLAEAPLRDRRYEAALKVLAPLKGITDPGVKGRVEALLAKVDGEIAKDFAEVEEEGRKLEEARRFRDALQHYQTHAPRFQGTVFHRRLANKPAVLEALEKAGAARPPGAPAPETAPPAPPPTPEPPKE